MPSGDYPVPDCSKCPGFLYVANARAALAEQALQACLKYAAIPRPADDSDPWHVGRLELAHEAHQIAAKLAELEATDDPT